MVKGFKNVLSFVRWLSGTPWRVPEGRGGMLPEKPQDEDYELQQGYA